MNLIGAVDDRMGMMFNSRRLSSDRVLKEKILSLSKDTHLYVNAYTAKQFNDMSNTEHLIIDEDFLSKAGEGDFCFAENVLPDVSDVDKLFLFKWNRKYPADFYFDLDISGFKLAESEEFKGSSHENITMEVYIR